MARHIRKIEHGKSVSRVTIPAKIIKDRGWNDCTYVTIDDRNPDCLIVRRLDNGENSGEENH